MTANGVRTADPPVKGRGRCPRCASRKVGTVAQPVTPFYARTLEVCGNCGTAWEPMPPGGAHVDSDGTPFPFPEPCDNCAFRPGSHEQQDTAAWKETMASLKAGAQFYCHKGVPVTPGSGHGFAYPEKKDPAASDLACQPVMVADRRKLRTCRGYLNMISRHWAKEFPPEDGGGSA